MNSYVSAITPWRGGCEADGVGLLLPPTKKDGRLIQKPAILLL